MHGLRGSARGVPLVWLPTVVLSGLALVSGCGGDSFNAFEREPSGGSRGEGGTPDTGGSSGAGRGGGNAGDDTGPGGEAGAGATSGVGGTSAGGTSAGGTSAGGSGEGGGGTGGVTRPCDLDAPFNTPEPLNDVNTEAGEARGSLSDDLLSIYFDRDYVLHRAVRSSPSEPFGSAVPLPSPFMAGDHNPALSRDGLRLFFTRGYDVYVATRSTALLEFSTPGPVAGVNSDSNDWMSSVSSDGTLYFHSDRDGDIDIFSAELESSGSYGSPMAVGSLNSNEAEGDAIVSADGLTMYFVSGRSPVGIHRARRSTSSDGFGTPEYVEELDSDHDEWPTWVSADGCMIMIASDRPGGRGGWDFFMAKKAR